MGILKGFSDGGYIPEDLFKLFDFVIWVFFGAGVIKESSGIRKWPSIDLKRKYLGKNRSVQICVCCIGKSVLGAVFFLFFCRN